MKTNGVGLDLNTPARRGAARPNIDTPTPPTSAIKSGSPNEALAIADANSLIRTPGSSSRRSSETHTTRRFS